MINTIELTSDQVDDIVVNELLIAYDLNNKPDRVDCSDDMIEPDYELLKSIRVLLQYFMTYDQYKEWYEKNGHNS